MSAPIRIGLVGIGKIARDQHIPALAHCDEFTLVAGASRNATLDGITTFNDLDEMLAGNDELQAISLCTPPQVRYGQARRAIEAGRHVFLEKPPGVTLSEVEDLYRRAHQAGVTLYASWHAREAAGVAQAREWLVGRSITRVDIQWREDVRTWHPGQEWIWQPGGLGVFDPGINALSIVTHILPMDFFLTRARLEVPENHQAPIGATLDFTDANDTPIHADLDWRQTGPQTWRITVETRDGTLVLDEGGSKLFIDDELVLDGDDVEYVGLYRHFAELIRAGMCDVDIRPFRHVADAFMMGERVIVDAFHD
ncbi:Gfo/Idh/MocA family protein [Larsenimonas rhizosphaerae]|uniref:Gfo/Idh/MocA family oxidoreductase n=1 Tax=Larsenimonas rhizosphaerae TaxID=2944682 RepID=A0AA41ZFE1_9GAMM|nr:Gfo/Idh/MocA family oxidoreductase [Larsenimonas rhizosphaerae]MCM2129624.1 Gfo/Idh/MocA family oxidoreductase [Larsenimonas rhizosphaerae]MCX2524282.1 Gfo/Idh/MocA family oxidoreductase [Larsenimonas rhizosphaerae]